MITIEKLNIYIKLNGELGPNEKILHSYSDIVTEEELNLIANLESRLVLTERKLTAKQFDNDTKIMIERYFDSEKTFEIFINYSTNKEKNLNEVKSRPWWKFW